MSSPEHIVEGSDPESESDLATLPTSSSEKRRARNARFQSWRLGPAENDFKSQVKHSQSKPTIDDELSVRDLLAKQESTPIITDPREYQIELFERAKQQNTIAVLDTGSGKTLIAVLLLRHIIDQELIDRATGKTPRISFFLVSYSSTICLDTSADLCKGPLRDARLSTIRRSGTKPGSQHRTFLRCYEVQSLDPRSMGQAFC